MLPLISFVPVRAVVAVAITVVTVLLVVVVVVVVVVEVVVVVAAAAEAAATQAAGIDLAPRFGNITFIRNCHPSQGPLPLWALAKTKRAADMNMGSSLGFSRLVCKAQGSLGTPGTP